MLLQDRPAERVRHRERAIRGKRDAIESRGDGVRIGDTPVNSLKCTNSVRPGTLADLTISAIVMAESR